MLQMQSWPCVKEDVPEAYQSCLVWLPSPHYSGWPCLRPSAHDNSSEWGYRGLTSDMRACLSPKGIFLHLQFLFAERPLNYLVVSYPESCHRPAATWLDPYPTMSATPCHATVYAMSCNHLNIFDFSPLHFAPSESSVAKLSLGLYIYLSSAKSGLQRQVDMYMPLRYLGAVHVCEAFASATVSRTWGTLAPLSA